MQLPRVFQRLPGRMALVAAILVLIPFHSLAQSEDEEEFTQVKRPVSGKRVQADPVDLFNKGQDAHSKGELDTALRYYRRSLQLAPDFAEAHYQIGSILEAKGDKTGAELSYRRALGLRPDWTLPMSALGILLLSQDKFGESGELLKKALKIDPESFPATTALADLYLRTRQNDAELQAILASLTALTSKSRIPSSVWATKAAVERALGKTAEARRSVNRALRMNPRGSTARSENIELLMLEGDPQGALASAERLLQDRPRSIRVTLLLARVYAFAGEGEKAVNLIEGLEKPGTEAKGLLSVIKAGLTADPAELEKMLASDPENVSIVSRLCNSYRLKDPEKALGYCRRASEMEPGDLRHAIAFGAALVQLRRYQPAVGLFRKLLPSAPENVTLRANLATALFQLGRYGEAAAEYAWITEKKPELIIAYYFLAISFDKLKRYVDALANYQHFLRKAKEERFAAEISKVNLRLPALQKQIKRGKGRK